jgi:bifunctional oligoribonuclease and PAP phosphatase NrnA
MSTQTEQRPNSDESSALDLLRSGSRFVLSGHVRPDGDCIGAQAALAGLLRALGKEVWIINPDPIGPEFDYLAKENQYRSWGGGDLPVHDVSVLLDCSELSRVGELGLALEAHDSQKLVIDHHIHTEGEWWDEAFVDVSASATGLLVYRIAQHLGIELDPCAAAGVFTSIVTDTGWFKYSNTDAETLRVAGDLLARGVDSSKLFGEIYQRRSSLHPLETAEVLASTEYHFDKRLGVICARRKEGAAPGALDADDALDILRSVGSIEVVLFLRELAGGVVKLSARSKNDFDVNALARQFGGGGHRKASGATIDGEIDDVQRRLVEAARVGFGLTDGGLS